MNVKQFKETFAELAEGVPQEGASGGQWKRVLRLVDQLEEPKTTPVAKPKEKKVDV